MNELMKYGVYFMLGGFLVSLSTYMGVQGRGFLAAFVSTFPAITGVTIILIYLNGGSEPAHIYARHLLWLVPAWMVYVGCLIFGINRFGFWPTLLSSLILYMCCVGLLKLALR
ncbi:MAG: DUF3147 domain-containing protein [Nitrospiraceae bacterium]